MVTVQASCPVRELISYILISLVPGTEFWTPQSFFCSLELGASVYEYDHAYNSQGLLPVTAASRCVEC